MKGRLAAAAAVAALALAAVSPARAGFRIQEADPLFPKEVTVFWFQDGKVRVDGALDGLAVIVDLKHGEGWLIERSSKRYAGGKIADMARIVEKLEGGLDDYEIPGGSGGRRAATEPARPLEVEVMDLGAGEKLQGYETRRSRVLVDGDVLEELWLAPDIQVANEIDLTAFQVALKKLLGSGTGLSQGYEESETYRNLRAGGYPLRQVLHFVGEKITLEVTSVAVEEFPPAVFAVPRGFTEIAYDDLLMGE